MDYKRNRRYFESIHWVTIGIIAVISVIILYFFILIGIAALLGLGAYIFFKLKDRPTDEEIDDVFTEFAHTAMQKGYGKLGLDDEEIDLLEPFALHGPSLDQISYDPAVKKGKDQKVRSSNHEVMILYFKERQLHFYYQNFSVIDDEQNEVIGEYFYEDIKSVLTASTTTMYFDSDKRRDEFFELDSIKLIISESVNLECAVLDFQTIQPQIRRMKNLIYRKKQA